MPQNHDDRASSTIVGVLILVAISTTVAIGWMATHTPDGLPPDARASWTGVAPEDQHLTHYRAEINALWGTSPPTTIQVATAAGTLNVPNVSIGDSIRIPCHGTPSEAALLVEGHVAETHTMPGCDQPNPQPRNDPSRDLGEELHHQNRDHLSCQTLNANTDTESGVVVGIVICLEEANLP
jgi:hypothetical protein